MSNFGQQFMPDFTTLLLAEKIIIDSQTYDRLINTPHFSYNNVSNIIKRLYEEGFVQIEDFDEIIKKNKDLLERMLEQDLKSLDVWIKPLKESSLCWNDFIFKHNEALKGNKALESPTSLKPSNHLNIIPEEKSTDYQIITSSHSIYYGSESALTSSSSKRSLNHSIIMNEILYSSAKRKKATNWKLLKAYLTGYLSHVNANILLSQTFETGFYDWHDYQPFYHNKFLNVAKAASPGEREIENIKKLFEISFPEFSFWQSENLLKALKDKRIQELRQLIDSACKGEVDFDREFANRTLLEVLKIESGMTKYRNIVSYLTMPLGFIPTIGTPIQKVAEEIITKSTETQKRKGYQWFYMISELAHAPFNKR